ncbi:MAG: NAD(P)-dependent oxidoreductase [Lactovum sp.]
MNKVLVNLPKGMITDKKLKEIFNQLEESYKVEYTSYASQEEFEKNMSEVSGIVMWTFPEFDKNFFESHKELKIVAKLNSSKATVEAAIGTGVQVTDYRHLWSPTVSELAMTFTLTGLRKVSQLHMDMREGKEYWVSNISTDMPAEHKSLFSAKLAIIGYGKIGQLYRKMLKPFNCEVHAYDPYLPENIFEEQGISKLEKVTDLDESYDVIVCCAANTTETYKLMSKEVIESLASDVIFINVGRSHLLDNEALYERLLRGEMYAYLDVFEVEPLPLESKWRGLKNAYLSPHVAGTFWALTTIFDAILEDLKTVMIENKLSKYATDETALNSLRDYKD